MSIWASRDPEPKSSNPRVGDPSVIVLWEGVAPVQNSIWGNYVTRMTTKPSRCIGRISACDVRNPIGLGECVEIAGVSLELKSD
jgi:hypothetical protein